MTLIVMAGLPGTGKTALAKAFHQSMMQDSQNACRDNPGQGPIILNKDAIRAALFPPDLVEYSTEQDDFCIDIMLRVAEYLFLKMPERIIILDGRTYSKRYQVESVERAAANMGANVAWIECVCDSKTAKKRLRNDKLKGHHPAANREPTLYESVKAGAEPLTVQRLSIDTTQPLLDCVAEMRRYLAARQETTPTSR